jgi:hypothetical protein
MGLVSMNIFTSSGEGYINTRTKTIGLIRRSEKPFAYWSIWIGSLGLDIVLVLLLIAWAMSK